MDYRQGAYRRTRFTANEIGKNLLLEMEVLEDGFEKGQFEREMEIWLHGVSQPQGARASAGTVEILSLGKDQSDLCLKVIQPAGRTLQIEIIF
jgi:hypothetical protein